MSGSLTPVALVTLLHVAHLARGAAVDPRVASTLTEPTESFENVWVSRQTALAVDPAQILKTFPNLRRITLPYYQFTPISCIDPTSGTLLQPERRQADYRFFHDHGVKVYGLFAPLQGTPESQIRGTHHEITLTEAFSRKPSSTLISPINESTIGALADQLERLIGSVPMDGIVVDLNLPPGQMYGYSMESRQAFVRRYHFDPVDIDYPLGLPSNVKSQANELIDLVIKDRLDRMANGIKRLAEVCHRRGMKFEVVSIASTYSVPPSTRAATLADWARWLGEGDIDHAFLTTSEIDRDRAKCAVDALTYARKVGIPAASISILWPDRYEIDAARRRFPSVADIESTAVRIYFANP